jgi:two-component system, response regulator YesN
MNVIVIDDQKAVADSLHNNLAWKEIGVDEVFTAYSAKEARAVFSIKRIDIMLSDIEMPEESGLSLLRYVRNVSPETECIFLTSHADFSYAQEALRLGSFEYILQPCRYEEIAQTVKNVITKIQQKYSGSGFPPDSQEIINTAGIRLLQDSGDKNTENRLSDLFDKKYGNGVFFPAEIQAVAVCNHSIREKIEETAKSILAPEESVSVIVMELSYCDYIMLFYGPQLVLQNKDMDKIMSEVHSILNALPLIKTAVYAGSVCSADLRSEIRLLHNMYENNIMQKPVIMKKGPVPEVSKDYLSTLHPERWAGILENGNGLVIKEEIRLFIRKADAEGKITLSLMQILDYLFITAVNEVLQKSGHDISYYLLENYTKNDLDSSYRTYNSFMHAVDVLLNILKSASGENSRSRIEQAEKYIEENISRNISRTEVAQTVYLNEEYFSRLFKEETGFTFKDYVTNRKIEYAKEMLTVTNFSISVIASKTGYDNFSYFSKIFRQKVHMTPQEYRNVTKRI